MDTLEPRSLRSYRCSLTFLKEKKTGSKLNNESLNYRHERQWHCTTTDRKKKQQYNETLKDKQ